MVSTPASTYMLRVVARTACAHVENLFFKWTRVHLMLRFTYGIISAHRCSHFEIHTLISNLLRRVRERARTSVGTLSFWAFVRAWTNNIQLVFYFELKFASISGYEMMYDARCGIYMIKLFLSHWTQHISDGILHSDELMATLVHSLWCVFRFIRQDKTH